jgi:hypothetical protein
MIVKRPVRDQADARAHHPEEEKRPEEDGENVARLCGASVGRGGKGDAGKRGAEEGTSGPDEEAVERLDVPLLVLGPPKEHHKALAHNRRAQTNKALDQSDCLPAARRKVLHGGRESRRCDDAHSEIVEDGDAREDDGGVGHWDELGRT